LIEVTPILNGYMGKILRVNLSTGKITTEPLPEDVARKYVGGRGLSAKILFDELKPGIDPTARHIEDLIGSMKTDHVPIVVHDAQFPEKVPALIAAQTGAKMVTLPIMPGGVPHTDTYIEMMDYIVQKMVEASK
jgi:ABC-type Zn uptake system ZnuABC Zn-binding protein ZnuA